MSEYQYYEFVAVDRPLTAAQQGELRALSTRARISASSFVNDYQWGDLKADPRKWMERYFDAHLYLANWGTAGSRCVCLGTCWTRAWRRPIAWESQLIPG